MDPSAHDSTHDRVRVELARLGADAGSAPEVPEEVTERVGAALRAAGPAHSIARPRLQRGQKVGLAIGVGAVLAGAAVGIGATMRAGHEPAWPAGPTAKQITVARPTVPLADAEIIGLLSRTPDYGSLDDPQRRAACLDAVGHPATRVWGARPVEVDGTPGILLVLPGDSAGDVIALVVTPECKAAHTGLLAETTVTRP
ncbi:hypothetical protein [Mycobacterium deserti]|uniref:Anti-sigma-M factor RsmA n=1 Tax=Mycobacterium deserti TaxID=2978347 RepID=A0ABT2MG78_9MYCO|nr:hypothetical protein [Mycobacterium deserti]MCT7661294.1 hypothetical protein [Mycobacterium deserti]